MYRNSGSIASFYCSWNLAFDAFNLGLCVSHIWHILWLKRGSRYTKILNACILLEVFLDACLLRTPEVCVHMIAGLSF